MNTISPFLLHFYGIKKLCTCSAYVKFIDCGPGQCSQYSDLLWAGRSGNRIKVEARSSASDQTGPWAYRASYAMGTGSFPGVKRPRRGVDHPPHLPPRFNNSRAIPVLHLWTLMTCSRVNFTFFYLYILNWLIYRKVKKKKNSNGRHIAVLHSTKILLAKSCMFYSLSRHKVKLYMCTK